MNLDTPLKLGQSTSLLVGFKADSSAVPFTTSTKPALYEKQVIVKNPNHDATWSWPRISLHSNVEDLLNAVFQIKLRPVSVGVNSIEDGTPEVWPSGALVLAGLTATERQKALADLSKQLGINLSTVGWSFALVRRSRKIGTATHPCYERGIFGLPDPDKTVKPDTLAALKALERLGKTSTNVSMNGGNGYLRFYETFGSHFVSSIDAGDSIFQVFAYAAAEYEQVVQVYTERPGDLSGPTASSFALYTSPRNEAGYGRTAAIGSICIASGDPALAKTLKEGLWMDETYAGTDSIFAPYVRSNAININTTLKKDVAIAVELSSLDVFAEYYRMMIWRLVFKAAMYTKYASGSGVAPYFINTCPYDLNAVFKDSDPIGGDGLLSTLATPSINIWQEKIDMSAVVLQFPELVQQFSVFASGIQLPTPVSKDKAVTDVPGSSVVSLLGHVISSGGKGPVPPHLRLTDAAFAEIKRRLFCGEFYGGLQISNSDASKTCVIMNGLMFEANHGEVEVVCDVRASPSTQVLTERITDIQLALVAAEARLNFLLGNAKDQKQSISLMKRFLLWLAGVAGSNYQFKDEKLIALQARAMYLANVAANDQAAGVPVPYLKYEAYKDVVNNVQNVLRTASDQLTNYQNQIRDRKAEEREVDREKALNENIINSGKLVQEYIGTQVSYQQSMEDMFATIVKDKERELDAASKRADTLTDSVTEQRTAVNEAIIKYQDAVADWQTKATIKAAIDIASSLFSLGFTFVSPASAISALKDLGETVQKIQKAVQVFDAVIKTYRAIKTLPSNPQKVVDVLKDIGPSGLELPTSLEWDEMKVNFEATLASGPAISAKTSLSAAFAILVLRGKALLQSQNTIQGIAAELSAAQQRITLHDAQKKRLDDLKIDLSVKPQDLKLSKIDLVGLSGQLIFFQRQMLMTLASTVVIQDRALQYEYLRPPTSVGSFSMLSLQFAILNQSQSINQGLTVQPLPREQPYPVVYEIHGVQPQSLTDNNRFTFNIAVNKREFASYNYVRVENVHVEVGGIVSTKSGKYYTELTFDGSPFFDRGFDGEILTFQTVSRIFTGLHEVSSSSHTVTDKPTTPSSPKAIVDTTGQDPFGGKISNITPFSTWQVSLPKSASNEGLQFDDHSRGVTVRLVFQIYAQLKENMFSSLEVHQASMKLRARGDYVQPSIAPKIKPQQLKSAKVLQAPLSLVAGPAAPRSLAALTEPSTATNVTVHDVLGSMSGSVCAGWDVVFSMTAKKVNDQLFEQYNDRQGNPKFIRETGKIVDERHDSESLPTKTEFDFTFNAPRLQFLLNNSNSAQIFLPIKAGSYTYSIQVDGKWVTVTKSTLTEADKAYVQGDVPLSILPGTVSSQNNVAVKLNGGAFSAKDFEASVANPTMAISLTKYFTNLKDGYEVYNLGTVDYSGVKLIDSLKPSSFKFNVYHTPSNRDLLQLFIATTGKLQSSTSLYLREPIPSVYDSSLIVNSKIFFQDVLPTSLGDGGIGLVLEATEPENDSNMNKAWSAKASAGSVSAPYPEAKVGESSSSSQGGTTFFEDYVKVDNNTAVVNITGMEFTPGDYASGWDAKMNYNVGAQKYIFKYGSRSKMCGLFGCNSWSSIHYKNYSLNVTINLNATLPLDVTGEGQNQLVGFHSTTSAVDLTGNLEPPAGACKCNDRELQKKFLENLRKSVPPKLVDVFNQSFDSVSLFALKNLLFPAKNLIDMKESHVPGDMVVFGNFTS